MRDGAGPTCPLNRAKRRVSGPVSWVILSDFLLSVLGVSVVQEYIS